MNEMVQVESERSRTTRLGSVVRHLAAALVGVLLIPVTGVALLQIQVLPAAAVGPGSLVVTSDNNNYSPCGMTNNLVDITLPAGSAIGASSSFTIEAWVKLDSATNPVADLNCGQIALSNSRFGTSYVWNQRSGRVASGGSYYMRQDGNILARCDGSDLPSTCPKVEIPVGSWTHVVMQKSVVGSVARLTIFANGQIVVSRIASVTGTDALRYMMLGGFGNNRFTSKVSYGQMRVSSGALYPTDGSSTFAPQYDFSTTASGGTVLALFKPQDNSTIANLEDLTGNGSVLGSYVGTSKVTASSDYAAPPPPAFSYVSASVTTTTGVAITTNNILSTGGDINNFSVNPALPNGLNLNTTTGSISGTPTVFSPTGSYTVTGTQNSSGLTTTASVSITVNKPTTSVSITLANGTVQVGVDNTINAVASVAGTVSFQTDLGTIPGCSAIATTLVAPFTASCSWSPTTIYYTMNATLTPTSSDLAQSTSTPSLTNIRGSLSLTSTGRHVYPDGSGSLDTNNSLLFSFPSGGGVDASKSFTIETWVKVANSTLNMKMSAGYGNSFYPDRGEGFFIDNNGTRVVPFVITGFMGYNNITAIPANSSWQNVVYQRTIDPANQSNSFDSIFVNGQLVHQNGNGRAVNGSKARFIKIGPFVGVTQIGPTQVLGNRAPYPTTGFAPSTTYSFGANTLALFQPSSTACGSSVIAPSTVTVSYQTNTFSCSTEYPVASPAVTSVAANSGPAAGGNNVVITGTNFVGLSGVSFGSTALSVADFAVNTFGTEITAKVPSGTAGTVDVRVTTSAGTSSVVAASKYSYLPPPTITGVSPSAGSINGGSSVVITGTNFTSASTVKFGSVDATTFTVNSSTQITATSPAGAAGVVDIKVTAPGGTSATVVADQFTYTSNVTVGGVSPSTGSTSGGTQVTITGTNFLGVTAVKFGATNATNYTVDSSTQITATSPAGTGTVNITVVATGGTSATSAANQFVYTANVTITGISTSTGSTSGGTSVVITGTNFTGATAVNFGATNVSSYTVISQTQISAVSPAAVAGTVYVTVTNGTTSANVAAAQFTYFALPTVTSLGTSIGLASGGTSVVVNGTNFTAASTVAFGAVSASSVTFNSATQLTVVSPSGVAGTVDITVTTLGGTSSISSADQFTYYEVPTVASIDPTSGPTTGSTTVEITGTNFLSVSGVKFGANNATSYTIVNSTRITAVSPAGAAGNVDVRVVNPVATSAIALYGRFTYLAAPTITSISPNSGMITGGTAVTITGTDLSNLLTTGGVMFGSIEAQSVRLIDPTRIEAISPATTVLGDVHITLTNASGTSAQTTASVFTYTKSNDATLSALALSVGTLSPSFAAGTNSYTISDAKDGLTVTPKVNQVDATVEVKVGSGSFAAVTSGSASSPLPLVIGANTITIKVTAHDGTTTNSYTIVATRFSNVATLSGASVKGQAATVGTTSETLGSETAGSIVLTTAQAIGSAATTFTTTNEAATITKIAKFSWLIPENASNFAAAQSFVNGAATQLSNGDYFVIQVTAADGTVNYTRVDVTVNSNIATLSDALVKGESATVGTASETLGSETAGSIVLTTAQAIGSAATTFTATNGAATITKIAKFSWLIPENASNFAAAQSFVNGAATQLSNGDYFVIQVTAADGTVNYTRVDVTVNSNIVSVATFDLGTTPTFSATVNNSQRTVQLVVTQGTSRVALVPVFSLADGATATVNGASQLSGQTSNNFTTPVTYVVTSQDGTNSQNYVVTVSFATSPTAPQNLTATGQQSGANLSWTAPLSSGGAPITGYVIQQSTDSTNWSNAGITNQSTTSYSITGLLNGTTYFFRVRAINDSGDLNYNYVTSLGAQTYFYVECSLGGSFYVTSSTIPSRAGMGCTGIATIPQGITGVLINAFAPGSAASQTNRGLTGLVFPPSGFAQIDQGGFRNLGLTSITIPASVIMVGLSAFENNPLTSVTITGASGGASTFLSQGAFNNQNDLFGLTTAVALTLGSGKIEIGHNFGANTTFSSIDFGTGIAEIGERAFYQNGIANGWVPIFPPTIKTIGSGAFGNSPNLKTIRFGSSTSTSITSISDTAFETSVTSVQYCAGTGTVLSSFLTRRLPNAVIWCATDTPNAPTNLGAVADSGQVSLSWSRGVLRNEAPTSDFLIQYSSNGGNTWTTFNHAVSTENSITVTGLSNGTDYLFRVSAVNLFGASSPSLIVAARPLGPSFTPIFGASTSTVDGFTVNVTNFDSSVIFDNATITSGTGYVSIGTPAGGLLPITVSGMSAGSTLTFSLRASKQSLSDGFGYASGNALQAALIPTFADVSLTTSGLTVSISNYDQNYQWSVSALPGNAAINANGSISVTGVNPQTAVTVRVDTSREGYASGFNSTTATTLQLLQVSYDGNGATGGSAPTDSLQYASNGFANVLGNQGQGALTLNGNSFAGWTINQNGTGRVYQPAESLQLASSSVTLYAKWSLIPYTVTYQLNGATRGSVPTDTATYTIGERAPIKAGSLGRTGYNFAGWTDNSAGTGVLYNSGAEYIVATSNITLWAQWSPETYTVTYDANGATGLPSKSVDSYTTESTPITLAGRGNLEKSGYNFVGWGVSAVSTPVADSYTVSADTKLYAQWRAANYSVTYAVGINGSGTPPTQNNVDYGDTFTLASATGLTASDGQYDYAFVAWSDGANTYSSGQQYLMDAMPVTLTAQWTRIYNVRYSFNGGSVATPIADQQKVSGDTIIVSTIVPTRDGYEFTGWKDQSGSVAASGSTYTVSDRHYLLYAQWRAISYSVTYDVNGGDVAPTETNHEIGDIFNVAAAPTKTGYNFAYWAEGSSRYNPGLPYQVGSDNVILRAVWTPKVFEITFDFNSGIGSPIAPIEYTFNTPAASLPTTGPTREDFTFSGWSSSATSSVGSYTFTPSGDILLHAVWVPSVYYLAFDAGSGFVDRLAEKVAIGQSSTLPSASRTNYTLLGWSTQQFGGTILPEASTYTPTADNTLYAQWTLQVFTVTFNGNSGTPAQSTGSMTYGSRTPIVLPTATRLNYQFVGWYSSAVGGYLLGQAGEDFSTTTSLTAHARWVQDSLYGMGAATQIAQVTVRAGYDTSFTAGTNGSTATVSYIADSLPDDTIITVYLENSTERVASLISTQSRPILSLIVAWVAPDGTVPLTTGNPITLTVTNPNITAGSKIYGLLANRSSMIGTSVIDGQVQLSISEDPVIVVAMVAPDAPTGVTATAIDSSSATINWTAPTNNGGSAITGYTATSSGGQTCTAVTTSCVMNGLTPGVDYTFSVLATNTIGDGPVSSASSPLQLTAPTTSTSSTTSTTTPGNGPSTPGDGSGGSSVPLNLVGNGSNVPKLPTTGNDASSPLTWVMILLGLGLLVLVVRRRLLED